MHLASVGAMSLDLDTRRVVAMVFGDRSEATARCLWEALPERHAAGDKGDGVTFRRRCARVVRKTLSFSKCLLNHLGALWHYHEPLP